VIKQKNFGLDVYLGSFLLSTFAWCAVSKKHLQAAIDAIDASADFINENKRVIAVPVLYFFLTIIVLLVWMA